LTQAAFAGHTGEVVQLFAFKTVPGGHMHCPLLTTNGDLHELTQVEPFQAVFAGQTQMELMLSKIIPPEHVMHW
jgi:hypothetical protein